MPILKNKYNYISLLYSLWYITAKVIEMAPQFKKGVLELCVLSLLRQGDKYGYELSETFS